MIERKPSKAEVLSALAAKTGLHRDTVKDLMKSGWTYKESVDAPGQFVAPGRKR